MPVKYSDIEWNGQPVVWYIVYRNIELTSGKNVEKPSIHEADDEVQEMCDEEQCFLVCLPSGNMATEDNVSWFVHPQEIHI
ncbi:Hypothetical predicted protein [Paramuricea clavata]|uniref:Uncharacterized protein n=1 Tax=Paramuricea clavata TaxID=317549 RepID=A0A7D9JBB6_PARCT|nr:Hypothetical predicted protein [Paramuricea clavata]